MHLRLFAAGLIGLVVAATPAMACTVTDPTGTPLNVRATPNGAVIGTLQNGVRVVVINDRRDARGRWWSQVRPEGATQIYGWVFAAYLTCR